MHNGVCKEIPDQGMENREGLCHRSCKRRHSSQRSDQCFQMLEAYLLRCLAEKLFCLAVRKSCGLTAKSVNNYQCFLSLES